MHLFRAFVFCKILLFLFHLDLNCRVSLAKDIKNHPASRSQPSYFNNETTEAKNELLCTNEPSQPVISTHHSAPKTVQHGNHLQVTCAKDPTPGPIRSVDCMRALENFEIDNGTLSVDSLNGTRFHDSCKLTFLDPQERSTGKISMELTLADQAIKTACSQCKGVATNATMITDGLSTTLLLDYTNL